VSFLAPLFLAGLAAIGIPIVVHLTNRPRREAYAFPSLMFLSRIPFRSVKRQRVRHWWLLALRIAVVALIVSAFARPLLSRLGAGGGAFAAGRDVVVLLDDSYSMRYGERWQRAVAAAGRVVDGLGPADRATIVVFDTRARALGQASGDRAALHGELAAAEPGFATTRYAAGLELARDIVLRSTLPRRQVVVISDFQRAGGTPDASLRLPDGTALEPINVAPGAAADNVAVVGALVDRSTAGGRDRATVTVRVANHGSHAVRSLAVRLVADGRTVQTLRTDVPAGADRSVTFQPLPVASRPVRVTIETAGDQLAADDAYHVMVTPDDVLRVTLVGAPGEYLHRALSVSADPRFVVTATPAPRAGDFAAGHVVLLDDPAPLAPALAPAAAAFVRAGGGMLVILGPRGATQAWSTAWTALLGGAPGVPQQPEGSSGAGLVALSFDHPIFEVFRAPGSGDFGSTRVYRYRRFRVDPASGATMLAQYDDGMPALLEHRLGAGKVLVWTSPFDNVWSDLPVQPVFLPLVHQMVRYLANFVRRPGALTVGALLDVGQVRAALGAATGADLVLETPDGRHVPLDSESAGAPVDTPGFYRVRRLDGRPPAQDVAVNVDPVEGDLAPLDVKAFVGAIAPRAGTAATAGTAVLSPAERERRQGVWWYLVVGAVVVALAETLLSNRLPALRRAGSPSQGAA
jgi:Aerotolerance regulator N-terminal/von Willebrand factor type A domain